MAHSQETKQKISKALKGKTKGRKRNPDAVFAAALSRRRGSFFNCWNCNEQFWRQPSRIKKGDNKFCSRNCYQKWQKGKTKISGFKLFPRKGDMNPNWKGGITPLHIKIRNSNEYKNWRNQVFSRDNWTCQECFKRSSKYEHLFIEAHHIKPFATYPDLRFELSNGVTLCKKCHARKPKGTSIYRV